MRCGRYFSVSGCMIQFSSISLARPTLESGICVVTPTRTSSPRSASRLPACGEGFQGLAFCPPMEAIVPCPESPRFAECFEHFLFEFVGHLLSVHSAESEIYPGARQSRLRNTVLVCLL